MERIHHDAGGIGKRLRLPYVHSPGSQRPAHAGEEERPVRRQQRERIDRTAMFEAQLYVFFR